MKSKIAEIQGLRGIAILLVVIFHFTVRWDSASTGKSNLYPFPEFPTVFRVLLAQGRLGVELFFMISGFVIALTLENSNSMKVFWAKRFARLWPPLLVCLPIIWLFIQFAPNIQGTNRSFIALAESFTLLNPNILGLGQYGQVTGVLWTLWVELQFYFLASIFYFRFKSLIRGLVASTFLGLVLVVVGSTRFGGVVNTLFQFTNLAPYLAWFTLGVLVYKLRVGGLTKPLLIGMGFCFLSSCLELGAFTFTVQSGIHLSAVGLWSLIFNAVLVLVFILSAGDLTAWPVLKFRPLVFIGEISYELYLLHEAIGIGALQDFRVFTSIRTPLLSLLVGLCLIGVSWLVYRYWSMPSTRWVRAKLATVTSRS